MMEDIHKRLVRKYHTLCSALGMTQDERESILEPYGVEHSTDLDDHDLLDLCASLERQADERKAAKAAELDRMRKQLIAAIGGWLKADGRYSDINVIKGVATRAAGIADFNKIPKERLRNLIHAFNNKTKDIRGVETTIIALHSGETITQKQTSIWNMKK